MNFYSSILNFPPFDFGQDSDIRKIDEVEDMYSCSVIAVVL